MARAIKSILANRKLFQGGGLVPPGNPMQNLNQANGILASSQPLIDSVVSDAVNPQGGRTLSMDSGGIAKFQFGGLGALDIPSTTQLASVADLAAIPDPLQRDAQADIAKVQQAKQAFEAGQITREQLSQVLDVVIAKYGSVENLEYLARPDQQVAEAEAPVHLTSPTSALPPTPSRSVEELQSSQIPTELTVPPAPQVISEQILEEKVPTPLVTTEPTIAEPPAPLVTTEPTDIRDSLERTLNVAADSREYQLRHRYGASNEEIRAVLDMMPGLTATDIISGEFTYGPLTRRSDEEYQASISAPGEAEAKETVTTVAEIPPSTPGGVHPDTLARNVLLEGEEEETIAVYKPDKLTDYLAGGGNYEEAPADSVNKSVDSIIKDAISGIENKPFDREALKKEIDAMLPMVEDDPEMEGYLIALMGASIMAGKDPNAWVNVGACLEKSLPAFINFKSSQKEKQRDREMSIATLTLQTALSRDEQDRQDIRGLQTLGIQHDIDVAKAAAEKKEYRVQNNHMLPPALYGGDKPLYTPAGTTLTLNEAELTRATDAGLVLLPWERGTWKLSDFVGLDDTSWDSIKAAKDGGEIKQIELFQGIDKTPVKINYMTPSEAALIAGGPNENAIGISELQSAYSEYDRIRKPTLGLMEDINSIQQLVLGDPGAFSGPGLIGQQLQDAASALRGLPGSEAVISFIDGLRGEKFKFSGLSKMQQAQTRSVIILAKIAPLLLDESGKTISDADRRMIARALGLTPVFNQDAGTWSIEITGQVFKNPQNLLLAMNMTQQALTRRLNEVDDKMRTGLSKFGIPMIFDQESKEAFERMEKLRGELGTVREEDNPYTQEGQFEPIAITAADLSFNFATQ